MISDLVALSGTPNPLLLPATLVKEYTYYGPIPRRFFSTVSSQPVSR